MPDSRNTLIHWLRDAHAMEAATVQNLSSLIQRMHDHPQVQARLRQHLEESRRHVDRVEGCLKQLDAKPSTVKEAATKVASIAQLWASRMATDEPVKHLISAYAFENFEIASYRALAAVAEQLGESNVAAVCHEIIREEEAMAHALAEQIPAVAQRYVMGKVA